jgi:hypothetical protein
VKLWCGQKAIVLPSKQPVQKPFLGPGQGQLFFDVEPRMAPLARSDHEPTVDEIIKTSSVTAVPKVAKLPQ